MSNYKLPWKLLGFKYDSLHKDFTLRSGHFILSVYNDKSTNYFIGLESDNDIWSEEECPEFKCQTEERAYQVAAYLLGVTLEPIDSSIILNRYNKFLERFK